jgi:hypothetical protein
MKKMSVIFSNSGKNGKTTQQNQQVFMMTPPYLLATKNLQDQPAQHFLIQLFTFHHKLFPSTEEFDLHFFFLFKFHSFVL